MKNKLIFTAFSPNTRLKDLRENILLLAVPLIRWIDGSSLDKIEAFFKRSYPDHDVFMYNYARSAMYEFFRGAGEIDDDESKDEVIFQGFTCAAASLPAIWAGFKPVYADIGDNSLSMALEAIKKVVTDRTKVIVVQYTLGQIPRDIELIIEFAKKKKILVLEDCTHYLPSSLDMNLGDLGDAAVFSFGRDKVVSGVDGGVLTVANPVLEEIVRNQYVSLTPPPLRWILERLHFAPLWWVIRNTWRSKIGKLVHLVSTRIGLLSRATSPEEKQGVKPEYVPSILPNAMAHLANVQIEDLEKMQSHRREIAAIYRKELKDIKGIRLFEDDAISPLRFPLFIKDGLRDKVVEAMADENIILGDWYTKPVAPAEIPASVSQYNAGSCPNAEKIASEIVNLPTHINISVNDALFVTSELRTVLSRLG